MRLNKLPCSFAAKDVSMPSQFHSDGSSHVKHDNNRDELQIVSSRKIKNSSQTQNELIRHLRMNVARLHKGKRKDQGTIQGLEAKASTLERLHQETLQTSKNLCADQQDAEAELQNARAELARLKRDLQALRKKENLLRDLSKDFGIQRQQLEISRQKLKASENDMTHCSKQLQNCQKALASSQESLLACQDDLFRLQPIAQVSDSDVSNSFDLLSQKIGNWVDGEIFAFEEANPRMGTEQIFSDGGDQDVKYFLEAYPKLGEYLIKSFVHHGLQGTVLGNDIYLFAMSEESTGLLQKIEQGMSRLKPRRGAK